MGEVRQIFESECGGSAFDGMSAAKYFIQQLRAALPTFQPKNAGFQVLQVFLRILEEEIAESIQVNFHRRTFAYGKTFAITSSSLSG